MPDSLKTLGNIRKLKSSIKPDKRPVMFDPDANLPRINRGMIYLVACLIAGIHLAREQSETAPGNELASS